ncbi:spermidine/putrescine-binding protein [Paraburkholderia sp. Clong3]
MGVTYGMKEGFATQLMFTVIPKAHPGDTDLIHAFINHSLDAGVQGRMAADVLNGPVNSKAMIPAESRAFVPSPQQIAEKAVLHDDKALAAVQPAWIKRYTEIFSA